MLSSDADAIVTRTRIILSGRRNLQAGL